MIIKLLRTTEGDTVTEGKLYIDDVQECYTVEDTDRHLEDGVNTKVYGTTAIPRGEYNISISFSHKFQKNLIFINEVPNFTGVRIHSGNSSEDTHGCIIVGSTNSRDDDDWVSGSRVAYNQLHKKVEASLNRKEKVILKVM